MPKQTITENESEALTANAFTRTGYTFTGWNTKADGSGTPYKNGQSITIDADMMLYAQWKVNTFKVQFLGNGATSGSMKAESFTYGTAKNLTANAFKRKGYSFTGWNTKADGSGKAYKNKASVKNLTSTNGAVIKLYARWAKVKYTIKYVLNKGKNNSKNPAYYYITTKTITLQKPTRKGYTFDGWFTDKKFKTKITKIPKGSTGNLTLYAKWKKK